MTTKSERTMHTIHTMDEIPAFQSEKEEAEFWQTHEFSDALMERAEPIPDGELPPPRPRTRPTAVRFDGDTLKRLRMLARLKGTGYQTLIKQFVTERLYQEELREGIYGGEWTRHTGGSASLQLRPGLANSYRGRSLGTGGLGDEDQEALSLDSGEELREV